MKADKSIFPKFDVTLATPENNPIYQGNKNPFVKWEQIAEDTWRLYTSQGWIFKVAVIEYYKSGSVQKYLVTSIPHKQ